MPRTLPKITLSAVGAVTALGAACVAYGFLVERRWFRRREYRLEVLPREASPVSILHLSDLHMVANDARTQRFIRSLPTPDVCVVTGDMLGEPAGVEGVVSSLRAVRGRAASYFVLGSNDYFAPRPLNYLNYFRRERRRRPGIPSRWRELVAQLEEDGWVHLRNRKAGFDSGGVRFEVAGLDDPHIERHDLRVAPREDPSAFGLAVAHSPEPAPELAALGYDLTLCGHTHGGQVRLPFVGALVTNSTIPTKLCMGLSRLGPGFLHVSPGLGTSKFAPFRFLCRPEATLLELAPRDGTPTS